VEYDLQAAEYRSLRLKGRKLEQSDIPKMVSFANRIMEERYELFLFRDENYFLRLLAETNCQNGDVLVLESGNEVVGILSYTQNGDDVEIQECLCENEIDMEELQGIFTGKEIKISYMPYMAYVLDRERLGKILALSKEKAEDYLFRCQDIFFREWV
jgi:hypothetical protein